MITSGKPGSNEMMDGRAGSRVRKTTRAAATRAFCRRQDFRLKNGVNTLFTFSNCWVHLMASERDSDASRTMITFDYAAAKVALPVPGNKG